MRFLYNTYKIDNSKITRKWWTWGIYYIVFNIIYLIVRASHRRHRFNRWVRKMPWRRKWQPTLVFLPGKSHGQRSLAGYSPWSRKRVEHDLATKHQSPTITHHLLRKTRVQYNRWLPQASDQLCSQVEVGLICYLLLLQQEREIWKEDEAEEESSGQSRQQRAGGCTPTSRAGFLSRPGQLHENWPSRRVAESL